MQAAPGAGRSEAAAAPKPYKNATLDLKKNPPPRALAKAKTPDAQESKNERAGKEQPGTQAPESAKEQTPRPMTRELWDELAGKLCHPCNPENTVPKDIKKHLAEEAKEVRAALVDSWKEDAPANAAVSALTSLFGEAFLARLPLVPFSGYCL